jgi:excisionase family DNA binding protein
MREPKSFEAAITSADFSSEDYCGTSYAAKLLGLSVATVQSLVEKGEIEAWKTLGGHRRIALQSINAYLAKNNPQVTRVDTDPKHRLRVLMVEDDENTRELYRYQFEDWDLPVDCTFMPSALEAMMDIASMRPDLLITDLSMPGVDGIEMLKACKRNSFSWNHSACRCATDSPIAKVVWCRSSLRLNSMGSMSAALQGCGAQASITSARRSRWWSCSWLDAPVQAAKRLAVRGQHQRVLGRAGTCRSTPGTASARSIRAPCRKRSHWWRCAAAPCRR